MAKNEFDVSAWLRNLAADADASWSIGRFGAIAEFMRDADEPATVMNDGTVMTVATARGALRFGVPPTARLFAYEGLSKLPQYWSHGVSLCLPAAMAQQSAHEVVTVQGPDTNAVNDHDQDAMLIDLGIGGDHIEACIRVSGPESLATLEPYIDRALFEDGSALPCLLQAMSPHRVFVSAVGRIEVYGPVPNRDQATENGPHTHVLPELLAHEQVIAATIPLPDGWIPVLNVYPANPARNGTGEPKPFDRDAHDRFQRIYRATGLPSLIATKDRITEAVRTHADPSGFHPEGRDERTAARITLRQLHFTDGPSDTLTRWTQALEPDRTQDQVPVP